MLYKFVSYVCHMKQHCVYALLDENQQIFYVGKTCRPKTRLNRHLEEVRKGNHLYVYNKLRQILARKNGDKRDIFHIVEDNITEDEIDNREIFYIKKFRDEGIKLTNLTNGGEGGKGFTSEINKRAALKRTGLKRSDETKKKISEQKKGIPLTQSHKDALKKAWETRKPLSPEHYQKISELNRGKINIQKYRLIDPDGVEHITENGLTDFCRSRNLTSGTLHKTLIGERIHHKGWKLLEKLK